MAAATSQFILSHEPNASDVVEFPRVIRRDVPGDTSSSDEVAVCNLASINIAAYLSLDGSLDQPRLRETVSVMMRMLDNVIDINFYPVEAARNGGTCDACQ
jgi:Ribonucleotide reductase, barrel domain